MRIFPALVTWEGQEEADPVVHLVEEEWDADAKPPGWFCRSCCSAERGRMIRYLELTICEKGNARRLREEMEGR